MGLKPGEFWDLTPYETSVFIGAQSRERIADAYLASRFNNAPSLPPLDEIFNPKKQEEREAKENSAALSAMLVGLSKGNVTVKPPKPNGVQNG